MSIDAAYGGEQVTLHLLIPTRSRPPFHAIVLFQGAGMLGAGRLVVEYRGVGLDRSVVESGRVLCIPILKGSFERSDGFLLESNPIQWRDHLVYMAKDLCRTVDYLKTRQDIGPIGYLGDSLGAVVGPIMMAVESDLRAGVFLRGGLYDKVDFLPESDPFNFLRFVRAPVLMLNGINDAIFPIDVSQVPMFERLGSEDKDLRHFEASHDLPERESMRLLDEWFTRHFGAVSTGAGAR